MERDRNRGTPATSGGSGVPEPSPALHPLSTLLRHGPGLQSAAAAAAAAAAAVVVDPAPPAP